MPPPFAANAMPSSTARCRLAAYGTCHGRVMDVDMPSSTARMQARGLVLLAACARLLRGSVEQAGGEGDEHHDRGRV